MASIATPGSGRGPAGKLVIELSIGLLALLVLLLSLGIAGQRGIAALAASGQDMQRSQAALAALAALEAALSAAEGGQREPGDARAATDARMAELRQLLSTDPAQYSRLVTLGSALAERFDALSAAAGPASPAELRRRALTGAAATAPADAQRQHDAVQAAVLALQTPAQVAATAAQQASTAAASRAALWSWLATAAALLLAAASMLAVWRLLHALQRSRAVAAAASARQQARESDLQRVLTVAPGPVCVLDADARIVRANPACLQLWNVAADAAPGTPFLDTVLPDDRRKAQLALDQLLTGSAAAAFRHRVRRADGSTALIDWHAGWSATDATLVCAGSDVTELQALRARTAEQAQAMQQHGDDLAAATARAQRAEAAQARLLSTVGRGLRDPLDAVGDMAGVLLQGLSGPLASEQRRELQQLHASAQRARAVAHDMLDIAHIDAGALVLRHEPFDLWEAIQHVATALRPRAQDKGLALQLDLADDLGYARGDERRLQQVLTKLLDNAIRCTAAGGITLDARPVEGGMLSISVADTGAGIAAPDIGRLFEPFHRGSGGSGGSAAGGGPQPGGRVDSGLGLGLAVAQRLARLMGGSIAVASRPGQGSTFTVTLKADTAGPGTSA